MTLREVSYCVTVVLEHDDLEGYEYVPSFCLSHRCKEEAYDFSRGSMT